MPATFNHGLAKGRNAGGAITKKCFVKADTSAADDETVVMAGAGGSDAIPPNGVSIFSVSTAEIAQGKGVSVVMDGRVVVTAGAILAEGVSVTSDANGNAVVATDGDWFCGVVDEPAAAIGDDCTVVLADFGNKFYAG